MKFRTFVIIAIALLGLAVVIFRWARSWPKSVFKFLGFLAFMAIIMFVGYVWIKIAEAPGKYNG